MTEEKRKEHNYFRRFKMLLYNKDGKLESPVKKCNAFELATDLHLH